MKLYTWKCDSCKTTKETPDNTPPGDWKTWMVQADTMPQAFKYETCPTCQIAFVQDKKGLQIVIRLAKEGEKTQNAIQDLMNKTMRKFKNKITE